MTDAVSPTPPAAAQPPLTLIEALVPAVGLVVLINLSFYLFGDAGALGPNQIALVVAATLGVGTFHYAPYAVFCWLSPLITIAFAFLGLRMPRLEKQGS